MGPDYSQDCLSAIVLLLLFWIRAVKEFHLLGPQNHAFSVAAPILWNKSPLPQPSGIWMVLTLLDFCKILKT